MRQTAKAPVFAAIIVATSGLGFAREIIIARLFGISTAMDCFIAAFSIVFFLSTILSPHTVQTLFMPGYQDERRKGAVSASRLFHNMAFFIACITFTGAGICYLLAPSIIALFMPGFDASQITLSADLMRVMLPIIVINGLSNLIQALCHSHQSFLLPISSHLVHNIVLLLMLLIIPAASVHVLATYYLYSAIIAALMLLPSYARLMPERHLDLRERNYLHMFAAGSPLLLLAFLDQLAQLLPRSFASLLAEGDIAALNYAFRLVALPVAVVALTTASFLFPRIIEAMRESPEAARVPIRIGGSLLLYTLCPMALFLALKNHEIVHLLFASDAFTSDAVVKTSDTMRFYALGMPTLGYMMLLNRVYAAERAYAAYMKRILIAFTVLVTGAWALIGPLGPNGIALAFSFYSISACILLLIGLSQKGLKQLIPIHSWLTLLLGLLPAAMLLFLWQTDHLVLLVLQSGLCMLAMAGAVWLRRDPVIGFLHLPTPTR